MVSFGHRIQTKLLVNSDKQDVRDISYISFLLSNVYILLQKCVRHAANGRTVLDVIFAVDSRTCWHAKRKSLNLKVEFDSKQTRLCLHRKTTWHLEDQQSKWRKCLLSHWRTWTVTDCNKTCFLANATIFHVPLLDWRYWMLDVSKVYASGSNAWDTAVHDASEEYKHRMVNGCSCGCLCIISHAKNSSLVNSSCLCPHSITSAATTATPTWPWLWTWCAMRTAPHGTWSSFAYWLWSTGNMSGRHTQRFIHNKGSRVLLLLLCVCCI